MLRRSTILVISLILCGVVALSVPALADRNVQTTKAGTPTVAVTVVKTTSASSVAKTEFVHGNWRDGLRFWFRNMLGLPPIQVETKPPTNTEPQKSGYEPGKGNGLGLPMDIARDHGGDGEVK